MNSETKHTAPKNRGIAVFLSTQYPMLPQRIIKLVMLGECSVEMGEAGTAEVTFLASGETKQYSNR